MKLVAKTDIGSQRSENQDSYRGGRRPDDAVWGAVCDGMGGARGGRLASTMALGALPEALRSMCMWAIPAFICFATTSCFSLQKTIPWCRRWWSRAR